MLVRCLYASRMAAPLAATVLDQILVQSRRNNLARGITGLLCHTNDSFMQVVEGGRDAIAELLAAIYADKRHQQVTILVLEEIAERRFANWSMGRVNVETINPAVLLKYSATARLDPFACSGPAMLALLADLISTGAIVHRSGA